jgi:hypothetical protein
MKYSSKFIFVFFLLLGIISCETTEDPTPSPEQEDFPDLQIFLDRFEDEAKLRGFNIDLSGMDVAYVDEIRISQNEVYCGIGYIRHPQTGKRTVLISKSANCGWSSKSDLDRESFFFHEMGHAFLNLSHDETKMCNGRYLSMMTEVVNQISLYNKNEPELRKYYLDELFDRLAANEQCINFGQDFQQDQVFFKNDLDDPLWRFSNDNGKYQVSRGIHENSGIPYLGISSDGNGENTGYIYKQLEMPNIPEGAKVILRTKVNAENLQGPGVAIAMRVYNTIIGSTGATTNESNLLTTEPNPVNGELKDHILELRLPNFTRRTIIMIPFAVMMPGTTGEAFFDDFELLVEAAS